MPVNAAKRRALFCAIAFPRHPGHSGGEIRDFHILRELVDHTAVAAYMLYHTRPQDQEDPLASRMTALHDPCTLTRSREDLFPRGKAPPPLTREHVLLRLRRLGLVPFGRYHLSVAGHLHNARFYLSRALQEAIDFEPDFFVVSPQMNPVGLTLRRPPGARTRWILSSYDIEAVRLSRLAAAARGLKRLKLLLEAHRALRYEQEYLSRYDGVVAVSERDRDALIQRYALEQERVLTIDNGVDTAYFTFHERKPPKPPLILFVGSLTYDPNRQAALRLVERILPRIWSSRSNAQLWIVGQQPTARLLARHDGARVHVTGRVADVRPYLAQATVGCFPLLAGSGTKYKVLEALSAGVPVVCSPLAAEGLEIRHGEHLLIAETDDDIADAILRLTDDQVLARHLVKRGRRRIESRYDWDVNLPRLWTWLERLAELPPRRAD